MKKFILLFQTVAILAMVLIIAHTISAQQSANQKPPVPKTIQKQTAQPVSPQVPLPVPAPPPPDCEPQKVRVPPAAQDAKPIITINALASGGSGQIQYPEASPSSCASPCRSSVTLKTELLITINAKNPGGVQNIGVTVTPPVGSSFGIERTAAPDSNNCVYPSLGILGHNGAGGIGSTPILFHMNKSTSKATVIVRATNFNGQSSLYAITYFVKTNASPDNPPPAKGCLSVHYNFTWGSSPAELAGQELPITVHFHGEFKGTPIPKSKAAKSFDLKRTYKVSYPYSPTWTGVSETFSNLMPGSWFVSGQYISGLGGLKHYNTPITCFGTVPAGTRCGVIDFNHDSQTCIHK